MFLGKQSNSRGVLNGQELRLGSPSFVSTRILIAVSASEIARRSELDDQGV
jgi:hypothetical protein